MIIQRLGWDLVNVPAESSDNRRDLSLARIASEHRERYVIGGEFGEASAEVSGKFRFNATNQADFPAVGDWVRVQIIDHNSPAIIHELIPRRNSISRHAAGISTQEQVLAANVDVAFLVIGLDGDYNPRRLERWVTTLQASDAEPVVILNKSDLCHETTARIEESRRLSPGLSVHALSALANDGLEQLQPYLRPHHTIVFLGSSGAGKSTIINRLLGAERQKTKEVSEFKNKGQHTTTHRQLLLLPSGAILIDTPGLREIQLWSDESSLGAAFSDIEALLTRCRFSNCSHTTEPGCALLEALDTGELEQGRYESYLKLKREIAHLERKQDKAAARRESREWCKRIQQHHKAMKELREMGLAGKKKDDKYER